MPGLTLKEVLARLSPLEPNFLIGFSLYFIFILLIITMMLQRKSNLNITLLLSAAIMCGLIDKVATGAVINPRTFGVYALRIAMFIAPMIVAGMTRSPKSRLPAIIASLSAGAYMFLRWFFEQSH